MSISTRKKHGLRILGDSRGDGDEVPLKAVGVDVTIKGFVANVQSTLTYENRKDVEVETSFVFPIDEQSAVYHFEAEIDGRHIVAECQDKTQARETYKEALATGHTAMLLSESDTAGDTFECKLGNLPSHKTATLTFSYVIELTVDSDGVVTFNLPTVLNPRYSPAGFNAPTSSSDTIHYTDIPYQMRFATKVEGQHIIKQIVPKKETMKVDISEDKKSAKITLADAPEFKFDHDLALTLEYEDVFTPTAVLEKGGKDKDGFLKSDVVMVDFMPDLSRSSELTESEFVFVIDCSGSMRGDRMAKASETVLLLLKSLPVDCFFNLVTFGSSFKWLFPSSKTYDEQSLKEAIALQRTLEANLGGTDILQPLKSMYAQQPKSFRQVFLLTDGAVSNTNQVISLARDNVTTARIFTFGIGSGASTSLIKNVAKVTNGLATFVQDNEKLQNKVMTVLKCAMQQPVTNLKLTWTLPSSCTAINIPGQVPPVFKGGKVIAYALVQGVENLTEGGQSAVVLTGDMGKLNTIHSMTFDLITNVQADESFPVHRLAAKAQIKEYEANTTGDDRKKGEITLVSVSANVVSRYTAFVGMDKEKQELVDGGGLNEYASLSMSFCSLSLSGMSYSPQIPPCLNLRSESQVRSSSSLCASSSESSNSSRYSSLSVHSKLPYFLSRKKVSPPIPGLSAGKTRDHVVADSWSMEYGSYEYESPPCPGLYLGKKRAQAARCSMEHESDEYESPPCLGLYLGKKRAQAARCSMEHESDEYDGLMVLINLQKFDGSWSLERKLTQVFVISPDILNTKQCNGINERVWATALSVAYLRTHYTSEKTLWEMIETKALSWLSSQHLAGKTVEELVAVANDALTSAP